MRGWLYVMMNPSMPGVVKIGKTARTPSERAQELSGATGVASPFIVVYEHHFENVDAAEDHVHASLERQGFRVSKNREFFSIPVHEAVAFVAEHAANVGGNNRGGEEDIDDGDDFLSDGPDDELSSLDLGAFRKEPWWDIMEEADDYYYGHGDTIQDFREALRLYKQAARMGCPEAYEKVGTMYASGEGVREDQEKALEFWKAGARAGNFLCLAKMAEMFVLEGMIDNAQKCLKLFLDEVMSNVEFNLKRSDVTDALFMMISFWIMTKTDMSNFKRLNSYKDYLVNALAVKKNRFSEWAEKGLLPPENQKASEQFFEQVEWYVENAL